MTTFKKLAVAGLAAVTMAAAFVPTSAEAQYRRHYHRGGGGWNAGAGLAAGLIGGALLGSALSRPAYGYSYYGAPAYADPYPYYGTPTYAAPAYAAPVYAGPAVQCERAFTGRYTRSGRPIYNKVCYRY